MDSIDLPLFLRDFADETASAEPSFAMRLFFRKPATQCGVVMPFPSSTVDSSMINDSLDNVVEFGAHELLHVEYNKYTGSKVGRRIMRSQSTSCGSPRGVDGLNLRKVKRSSSVSLVDTTLSSMEDLQLQHFRRQPVLEATHLVLEIEAKERDIENRPSVELVSEIMDFYRQAIERFEEADDVRQEEVVSAMRTFLTKPVIARILNNNGELQRSSDWKCNAQVPEGEVLVATEDQLDGDDDSVTMPGMDHDDSFENVMNSFLKDAERVFELFQQTLELDGADTSNMGDGIAHSKTAVP